MPQSQPRREEPRRDDRPQVVELTALTAELDAVDSGQQAAGEGRRQAPAPLVKLGRIEDGGLAPVMAAIVERGVRRRPNQAALLAIEVQIKLEGPYPPTRVVFGPHSVLVEDGPAERPDLKIEGPLTDLVHLLSAPVTLGVPNPVSAHGRAALSKVASGRVRFEGPLALRRRVLTLLHI